MWETLQIFTQLTLVIWIFLISVLIVGYFVLFSFWICYAIINPNNSKNRTSKDYLQAMLKQEGYNFKLQIKSMTRNYLNVDYEQNKINVKNRIINKKDIWSIYYALINVQTLKWKQKNQKYVGFLHLSYIIFLISFFCFISCFILMIIYPQQLISDEIFNLFISIFTYSGLIALMISWIFWVFIYEQMRKELLLLAADYLNTFEYAKIKRITFLKNLFVGSENLFIVFKGKWIIKVNNINC